MSSRVGELRLRIRAPADRASAVRPEAEVFAREVLSRCDAQLSARAPGRVVLMRRLEMRWRLLEAALDHDGEIDAFAGELADSLEQMVREDQASFSPASDVAIFEDEAHWRAEYLATIGGGGATPWFFEPLVAEGEPPGALLSADKRHLAMPVLERLSAGGRLAETLRALSRRQLGALAAVVGMPDERNVVGTAALPEPADGLAATAAPLTAAMPDIAARLCRFMGARRASAGPAAVARVRQAPDQAELLAADAGGPAAVHTEYGGLFYLLRLVLELGLAESLWRACLPEGRLLAETARLLLDSAGEGDPAVALFGGATSGPLPSVLPDQQEEISLSLLRSLAAALQRRSGAPLPEARLAIAEVASGRLLVATAVGGAFPLFAWPASSPQSQAAGLAAFRAIWPRAAAGPDAHHTQHLRPDGDLPLAAILAQSAGALAQLFVSRLGVTVETPVALAERFLRIPASVALEDAAMDVHFPMERIDVDVRRAGLDADPGWIPWLERRVTFTFERGGAD